MRQSKQYTLAEVGEIVGVTSHTIRNYVRAGLIDVSRDDGWMKVGKEELDRIKREGVIAGKPGKRAPAARTAAKKPAKRAAAATRTAAKKPAKRAAAATRTAAKKPAKRAPAARTAAKKSAKRAKK
ncbi:hypothetical protein R80B4_02154 [Fibrobacteres bacterium R8-0-B4]